MKLLRPLWLTLAAACMSAGIALAGPTETAQKEIELGDETALRTSVEFGAGTIDLHKAPAHLILDAQITYDPEYVDFSVDYEQRRSQGLLALASEVDGREIKGRLKNEWDIGLSGEIPLDLELEIGAAEARLNLSKMALTRLELDVGAASAEVWWESPNPEVLTEILIECGASSLDMAGLGDANFEYLQFEGGVGNFELDFSGAWTRSAKADFEVGLGTLELTIPENIGTRIEIEDSFLSDADIDRYFKRVDDHVYESDNYETADVRLDISIQLGMGAVDVRAVRP
jgi:hypothetical protein